MILVLTEDQGEPLGLTYKTPYSPVKAIPSVKYFTFNKFLAVPIDSGVQLLPPFSVTKTFPLFPTTIPLLASRKDIEFRSTAVIPVFDGVQSIPPLMVL